MDRPIEKTRRRLLVLGLCAAALAPRLYLAMADQGMVWADEIFQTLEQGHRVAFGYGLVPWEFKVGARSWLLPGVLGAGMRVLDGIGVTSGFGLVVACKLAFAALGVVTLLALLRMAYALRGASALWLVGLSAIAFPAGLVYGTRVLAEVASAPCMTWGLALLLPWGMAGQTTVARSGAGQRSLLAAGALLGLGTLLRYQNGVLLPVVVLVVAVRAGWRRGLWLAGGAAAVLVLGGLLDWITWGRPFQSFLVYLRFNLIEGGASQWGIAKRGFYLRTMLATNGPLVALLGVGFVAGLRRTWPLAALVLVYLGVLSEIPHKELRFLFPVVPLFLLCAAVGLAGLARRLPFSRWWRQAVALSVGFVMLAAFALRARQVSFADLGQSMDSPSFGGPTSSLVWRAFDERNRLFEQAGRHADLCGLAAPGMNPYWTGGYSYVHRRVPLLWTASPIEREAANYLVASPGQRIDDARYVPVASAGAYVLLRRDGLCVYPPRGSGSYGRLAPRGVPGS